MCAWEGSSGNWATPIWSHRKEQAVSQELSRESRVRKSYLGRRPKCEGFFIYLGQEAQILNRSVALNPLWRLSSLQGIPAFGL